MKKKTILITGITGFLGSHIARALLSEGHTIIALKRSSSELFACKDYCNEVKWYDIESDWEQLVLVDMPTTIIHAAWIGVASTYRNEWSTQIKNIEFTCKLLEIAKKCNVEKFITLGSFAEYGFFTEEVTEEHPLNPTSAYGGVKVATQQIVKSFCELNSIKWYWFRLFSFFGEGESSSWLIPHTIISILGNKELKLTKGDQQYAYLHVSDLSECFKNIVKADAPSGIYNISSSKVLKIKDIITKIKNYINPNFKLDFGSIPYRENQQMLVFGNTDKYHSEFGPINISPFDDKLQQTILYYTNKIASDESL